MIQTKMIIDAYYTCDERLDTKINKFIKEKHIKVIDIKFAGIREDNRATALIIYEVEEEYE